MRSAIRVAVALDVAALGVLAGAQAQSTHLSALEKSIPAALAEPTAGAALGDVEAIWSDPTATLASGAFAGLYRSSYAGVNIHQFGAAFHWGPRWSATFGSTEIDDLFDSSLVADDPGFSTLRVRALTAGLDVTTQWRLLRWSFGFAYAADETLGEVSTSTVARAHVRLLPVRSDVLTVGVRFKRAIGGSIEPNPSGEGSLDVAVARAAGFWRVNMSAAVMRGSVWRYSEIAAGAGVAGRLDLWSQLSISAGLGYYTVTFGADRRQWYRSVGVGVVMRGFAVDARVTGMELGVGSGLGISVGYKPGGRATTSP
jgi:hypothetical protein